MVSVFATNYRRFKLDTDRLTALDLVIEEISAQTVPPDFGRRAPHRCWVLRRDTAG